VLAGDSCTTAYVSRIEAGARIPSYQLLLQFAARLGTNAEFLASGRSEHGVSSEFLEAEVALRLGDYEQAAQLYEDALNRSDSESAAAQARLGLGRLELKRGDMGAGIELLEHALDSDALPPGDASAAADALGRGYAAEGRFDEAIAIFSRFLAHARDVGDRLDEVLFGVLLANTYTDQGQLALAQSTLAEILDLARKTIDPLLRASLYWSQSRVYSSQGQPDRAAEYAALTVSTLRASDQTLGAARALALQALIENDRGNAGLALELVDEGEPVVAAAGDSTDRALFTIERARALAALGRPDEAATLLLAIAPTLKESSPANACRAFAAAAELFRTQGDTDQALELYELAVETSPTLNRHVANALQAMAEIYEARGDVGKALELIKQALPARTHSRA